jgi:hypothetical protein
MRDFMVLLRRDRYNNNREIKQGNYFFYRIVYDCFSFIYLLRIYSYHKSFHEILYYIIYIYI